MKLNSQLINAQLEQRAGPPTKKSEIVYNTLTSQVQWHDGTAVHVAVDLDEAQTLLNKTLTSPTINSPTVTSPTVTGGTFASPAVTTPTGIVKGDVGLGNVDNTSDATKNSAVATLTNKTLTAPVINSPTGIVKADVGLGNCDNTSDVNKPVSTAQAAADALNLKIASNLSDLASVPTARTNLGLGTIATQAANNVAITGGSISGTKNVLYSDTLANLTALPRLAGAIYYATDKAKNFYDNGSVLTAVGSGSGGGSINYMTGCDFESGVVGACFVDADSTTGALSGGSPTATITTTTTNPLNATTSGVYTPQATIGAGWAVAATINREDQGVILQGQLSLEFATPASYVDGDLKIAVYDVTGTKRLAIMEGESVLKSLGPTKQLFRFQTSSNSTSYRIGLVQATTNTSYGSVKFEATVGPQLISRGTAITDWVSYTPSFTAFGTVSGVNFKSRRVGDSLEVQGSWVNGTTVAATAAITLGYAGVNGNVIADGAKVVTGQLVGHGASSVNSTTQFGVDVLAVAGSNAVNYSIQNSTQSATTAANGNAMGTGTGAVMSVFFTVPIQGWGSATSMSADVGSRPVIFRATGVPTGTLANGSFNVATFPTVQVDNYGKYSGGVFTIPKTAYYDLHVSCNFTGTYGTYGASWAGFNINGGAVNYYKYSIIASSSTGQLQAQSLERGVYLTAGTTIQPTFEVPGWTTASFTNDAAVHTFSIIETTFGSQQIAATERICATYGLTATQLTSSDGILKYDTKVEDTHGLFSTVNGLLTSNFNGKLRISVVAEANGASFMYVKKNTTAMGYLTSVSSTGISSGVIEIPILSGDTVAIYSSASVTFGATTTGGYQNQVTFERVG